MSIHAPDPSSASNGRRLGDRHGESPRGFAAFLLRGGRLTKLAGEVASCAPALGGAVIALLSSLSVPASGLLGGAVVGGVVLGLTPEEARAACVSGLSSASQTRWDCTQTISATFTQTESAAKSVKVQVFGNASITVASGVAFVLNKTNAAGGDIEWYHRDSETHTRAVVGQTGVVHATNDGTGKISIRAKTEFRKTGNSGVAILAKNTSSGGGEIVVNVASVTGSAGGHAIQIDNDGGGKTEVRATGAISGGGDGIRIFDGATNASTAAALNINVGSVSGKWVGMRLRHRGGGNVTVTATGAVVSTQGHGNSGDGAIHLESNTGDSTVDLSVATVTAASGRGKAIFVEQRASGAVTISASGSVSRTHSTGGAHAVELKMHNSAAASIALGGTVTAPNGGDAVNVDDPGARAGAGGSLSISVAEATGGWMGIRVLHKRGGDVTITATGTVTGGGGSGGGDSAIFLKNDDHASALKITAATVTAEGTGDADGIRVEQEHGGTVEINAGGEVTSDGRHGIYVKQEGNDDVTINVSSTVTGGTGNDDNAIKVGAGSSNDVTINLNSGAVVGTANQNAIVETGGNTRVNLKSGVTVRGSVTLGGGNDTFSFEGGTVSGSIDLGAGSDTVAINTSGAVTIPTVSNFESLELGENADLNSSITLSGDGVDVGVKLAAGSDVNVTTGTAFTMTQSGAGGITFTQSANGQALTGEKGVIHATNSGAGDISITTTGEVKRTGDGDSIYAKNADSAGGAITISVGSIDINESASGDGHRLRVVQEGSGAVSINANGTISGPSDGAAISVSAGAGDTVTVDLNSGAYVGKHTSPRRAIEETAGNTTVEVKSGATLRGAVSLGAGTDVLRVHSTATLSSLSGVETLVVGTSGSAKIDGSVGVETLEVRGTLDLADRPIGDAHTVSGDFTGGGIIKVGVNFQSTTRTQVSGERITIEGRVVSGTTVIDAERGNTPIRPINNGRLDVVTVEGTVSEGAFTIATADNRDFALEWIPPNTNFPNHVQSSTSTRFQLVKAGCVARSSPAVFDCNTAVHTQTLSASGTAVLTVNMSPTASMNVASGDAFNLTKIEAGGITFRQAANGRRIITSNGHGIFADNSGGGDVTVNVNGTLTVGGSNKDAIHVENAGNGAVSIISSSAITTSTGHGIFASNADGGDVTVNVTNTLAASGSGKDAIHVENTGTGAASGTVSIMVSSTVTASASDGDAIFIDNGGGASSITLASGASVGTASQAAIRTHAGDTSALVRAGATLVGSAYFGAGADSLSFESGGFQSTQILDGGTGPGTADAPRTDRLSFIGDGQLTGSNLRNWEAINFGRQGATDTTITFSENSTTLSAADVTLGASGKLNLQDDAHDDILNIGGNFHGDGGTIAIDANFYQEASDNFDKIHIDGDITGTTVLDVSQIAGSGTLHNRMKLITVKEGASVSTNAFTLSGETQAGGFDYELFYSRTRYAFYLTRIVLCDGEAEGSSTLVCNDRMYSTKTFSVSGDTDLLVKMNTDIDTYAGDAFTLVNSGTGNITFTQASGGGFIVAEENGIRAEANGGEVRISITGSVTSGPDSDQIAAINTKSNNTGKSSITLSGARIGNPGRHAIWNDGGRSTVAVIDGTTVIGTVNLGGDDDVMTTEAALISGEIEGGEGIDTLRFGELTTADASKISNWESVLVESGASVIVAGSVDAAGPVNVGGALSARDGDATGVIRSSDPQSAFTGGGVLRLEADFATGAGTADRLVVDGTVSGVTTIEILDIGGVNTTNSVVVAEATSDALGTISAGSFVVADELFFGSEFRDNKVHVTQKAVNGTVTTSGEMRTVTGLHRSGHVFSAGSSTDLDVIVSSDAAVLTINTAFDLSQSGTGGVSFTQSATGLAIKGGESGIAVSNAGGGAVSISATGPVVGLGTTSDTAGIHVVNDSSGTGIAITAADVTGEFRGIYAVNSGSGAVSVAAQDVAGGRSHGIQAINGASGEGVTVSASSVFTRRGDGIRAISSSTASVDVSVGPGAVDARGFKGSGIRAESSGGNVTITASAVSARQFGIWAKTSGEGAISINASGAVVGGGSEVEEYAGIRALQNGGGSAAADVGITAATVSSGGRAIWAHNKSQGDLTISAGALTATKAAIHATNEAGGDLTVSVSGSISSRNAGFGESSQPREFSAVWASNSGADLSVSVATVSSAEGFGVRAHNSGTGATAVRASGTVSAEKTGVHVRNADASAGGTSLTVVDVASDTERGIDVIDMGAGALYVSAGRVQAKKGEKQAIFAENKNGGSVTVSASGLVSTQGSMTAALHVRNDSSGESMSISVAGVEGGSHAIDANNSGSGMLSITASGEILADGAAGIGILAHNEGSSASSDSMLSVTASALVSATMQGIQATNKGGGDLTISAAAVTGVEKHAIYADNDSGGDLSVSASGLLSAFGSGTSAVPTVMARNDASGGSLDISVATVSSVDGIAISAENMGDGSLTIAAGAVTAGGSHAIMGANTGGGSVSISASGAVRATGTADAFGIHARNDASGAAMSIDVRDVTTSGTAIDADNSGDGGLTVSAVAVTAGGTHAVKAVNTKGGSVSITAVGDVSATGKDDAIGVHARNDASGAAMSISVRDVTTSGTAIYADNKGDGSLTVTAAVVTAGGSHAIRGSNSGGGSVSIFVSRIVRATGTAAAFGIEARNDASGAAMSINVRDVTASGTAIDADNMGDGSLTIAAAAVNAGGRHAIKAVNANGGSVSISTDGAVTQSGNAGGAGIYARNNKDGAAMAIAVRDVTSSGTAIDAENKGEGGGLSISAAAVTAGGSHAVKALNFEGGSVSISLRGDVSATGDRAVGIYASNDKDGAELDINARDVTAGGDAIRVVNKGNGSLTVSAGAVTAGGDFGVHAGNERGGLLSVSVSKVESKGTNSGAAAIYAVNRKDGGLDIVSSGDVMGAVDGVKAETKGDGALSVTVTGSVTAMAGHGIQANGDRAGSSLSVSVGSGVGAAFSGREVSGKLGGITVTDKGSGALTVSAGAVSGGDGYGVNAQNDGGGDLSIRLTGDVSGKATSGSGRGAPAGVSAYNRDGSLAITAMAVTGAASGIWAKNSSGGALTISANGSVTAGGDYGVRAENGGSGTLSLVVSGAVKAEGSASRDAAGVFALNEGRGLTVGVAGVEGAKDGIRAELKGGGSVSVSASGDVEGKSRYGIHAYSREGGDQMTVSVRDVAGGEHGLHAVNKGSGNLTISAAAVSGGSGYGVRALNHSGGALAITLSGKVEAGVNAPDVEFAVMPAAIAAYNGESGTGLSITASAGAVVKDGANAHGIWTRNEGSGATALNVSGAVVGTGDGQDGIHAIGGAASDGMTITTTGSVSGGATGIHAENRGSGALAVTASGEIAGSGSASTDAGVYAKSAGSAMTITVRSTVTSKRDGIRAINESASNGTDLTITLEGGARVSGDQTGVHAKNSGSGALSVTVAGTAIGDGGDGSDGVYASNASGDLTISIGGSAEVRATSTAADSYGVDAKIIGTGTASTLRVTSDGLIRGGIRASNRTSGGAIEISVGGRVEGGKRTAIDTDGNGATAITLRSGADVRSAGIATIHDGDGDSTVTLRSGSRVEGAVHLGGGDDRLVLHGLAADGFSEATFYGGSDGEDGGDDAIFLSYAGSQDVDAAFTAQLLAKMENDWERLLIGTGFKPEFAGANELNAGLDLPAGAEIGMAENADPVDSLKVKGNLRGGGRVRVDVDFDTQKADTLMVSGNVSGITSIHLNDLTESTAKPQGQNMVVVSVEDSGSVRQENFKLDDETSEKGAVAYNLALRESNGASEFVLERKGISSVGAILEMAPPILADGFAKTPSLATRNIARHSTAFINRVGAAGQNFSEQLDRAGAENAWLRVYTDVSDYEDSNSGGKAESSGNGVQGGMDVLSVEHGSGNWVLGVSAQYGSVKGEADGANGQGVVESTGYGVGGNATWFGRSGVYVDAVTQLGWVASDYSSRSGVVKEGAKSTTWAASLEVGQRFRVTPGASVLAQGQLGASRVNSERFTTADGTNVEFQTDPILSGRLGIGGEFDFANGNAYVLGSVVVLDAPDSGKIVMGESEFGTGLSSPQAEISFGRMFEVSDDVDMFVDGSYRFSLENEAKSSSGISLSGGMQWKW